MRKIMCVITALLSAGFVALFAAPAAAQGIHCGGYWGEGCMRPAARERQYRRNEPLYNGGWYGWRRPPAHFGGGAVPHRMPQGFGGGWTVRERHIYQPPMRRRTIYRERERRVYTGTIVVPRGTIFVPRTGGPPVVEHRPGGRW